MGRKAKSKQGIEFELDADSNIRYAYRRLGVPTGRMNLISSQQRTSVILELKSTTEFVPPAIEIDRRTINHEAIRVIKTEFDAACRMETHSNPDEYQNALYRLAQHTWDIYTKIFPEAEWRTKIDKWINAHQDNEVPQFRVISEEDHFPWGILYTEDPTENGGAKLSKFLGSRMAIFRRTPNYGPIEMPDRKIEAENFRVKLISDRSMHENGVTEDQVISRINSKSSIPVSSIELRSLDASVPRHQEVKSFRDFLVSGPRPQVVHFCCHGFDLGNNDFGIKVSDEFTIKTAELPMPGVTGKLNGEPTVFVNACEAGQSNGNVFSDLVLKLLNLGARSVIAPDFAVEQSRATQMARWFYRYWRHGDTAIDSLFHANRHLLTAGSAVGLAYGLYGQEDSYLSKAHNV